MKIIPYLFIVFLFFGSCTEEKNTLETILASDNPKIKRVMKRAGKYEVQILYSQINRDSLGKPYFTDFEFNVDDNNYFYPASTVKMPIAFLALEKLKELQSQNIPIDRNTEYKIEGDSVAHSISKDIIEIFAVSDNDAYNRLYDFLGRDYINLKMKSKGLIPVGFHIASLFPIRHTPIQDPLPFTEQTVWLTNRNPLPIRLLNLLALRE